jgi:cellulose 1,4-beta-cellobiosidase
VPKCAVAAPVYKRSIALTIATLSRLPNTSLYIDSAHAGWLGWEGNIGKTAVLLAELLSMAKKLNPDASVRGVATDVSNYNGVGTNPTQGKDELAYHQNLAPLLRAQGFPAHFIVDQGRSGNQVQVEGDTWCNLKTAGFGPRPTTNTVDPSIQDAFVWAKPGGESDGTSDVNSARFDEVCGEKNPNAFKPSPEAGEWHALYFEQLLKNASPTFA